MRHNRAKADVSRSYITLYMSIIFYKTYARMGKHDFQQNNLLKFCRMKY